MQEQTKDKVVGLYLGVGSPGLPSLPLPPALREEVGRAPRGVWVPGDRQSAQHLESLPTLKLCHVPRPYDPGKTPPLLHFSPSIIYQAFCTLVLLFHDTFLFYFDVRFEIQFQKHI